MKNDPDSVAVEAHAIELTVWDVPPAVVAGERFRFAVGARCSAGCDMGGRALSIVDREGSVIACRTRGSGARSEGPAVTESTHRSVQLGRDVCAGTEALYFAELEARAPLEAGSHAWEAKIDGWNAEVPHAAGSFPLRVRVVDAPECEVTVTAIDRETQTPIAGSRVVMHPYRAVTDDKGAAKVRVARGRYDILVSGSRYLPACASVEVTADMETSAELEADQPWTSPDEDLE
jgi:hypothetical protein